MASVEIKGLQKAYGSVPVLRDIDLSIADREFLIFVGPSGCGKSTLLRMIAGLEAASGGDIRIDGRLVNNLPAKERDIAMVFQNYALYPHMTVFNNMAFSLKLKGVRRDEIARRVNEAAGILNLGPYLARRPNQLSGGQRQRVAMGRAIVRDPKVFLFDEPLSNLDAKLRVQMRTEIKALHQRLQSTIVYVTHDQIEAMTMADRIVVMNQGRIEQIGRPLDLYDQPNNLFVAGFIGSPAMNFVVCKLEEAGGGLRVRLSAEISFPVPASRTVRYRPHLAASQLLFGLRPEHIVEQRPHLEPEQHAFEVPIDVTEPMGMETQVYFSVNGSEVCGRVNPGAGAEVGQRMKLVADVRQMHLIDEASGRVL